MALSTFLWIIIIAVGLIAIYMLIGRKGTEGNNKAKAKYRNFKRKWF